MNLVGTIFPVRNLTMEAMVSIYVGLSLRVARLKLFRLFRSLRDEST